MSRHLWKEMTTELHIRSQGQRESGAFFLAHTSNPRRIVHVVYYDDLDSISMMGALHFRSNGFGELWDICAKGNMMVVGDIHTHPGSGVQQSAIDRANPMIDRKGHIALILPRYAADSPKISAAGVYEHLGKCHWRRLRRWLRWCHIRTSVR